MCSPDLNGSEPLLPDRLMKQPMTELATPVLELDPQLKPLPQKFIELI